MSISKTSTNGHVEILIAQNSPAQGEQLKHALEQRGYTVTVAANGKEALEAACIGKPTLIISDIAIPDMDGYTLCKCLKTEKGLKDVPVILMTSLSGSEDVVKGLECGADKFIRKPFDEAALLSRIDDVLSNRGLREGAKMDGSLQIKLGDNIHHITSEPQHILDLLVSTYEDATRINAELGEKEMELTRLAAGLEREVEKRTATLRAEIAEHKIAAKQLQQSEEQFRVITESISDLIAVLDPEGKRLYNSPSYKDVLGDPSTLVGSDSFNEIHPDDREKIRKIFQETVRTGRGQRSEYRFLLSDGSIRYIESQGSVIPDSEGKTAKVVVVSRDVTERKRAEEALRESEEKYRSLVSNIPDVSWTLDAKRRFVFISSNIESVSGFSPDEIYQQGARIYLSSLHPDDVHKVTEGFRELFAEGRPFDVEVRVKRKDGEWIWVHHRALATYDKNGIRYADGLLSDITARKRAEEALRQSETTLRSVLKAAPVGISIVKDRVFQSANDRWHEIVGYTEAEMLGQTARRLYESEEEYQRVGRELYQDLPKQGLISVETQQRRSDGALLDVILTAAPLNPHDPSAGNLVAIHDVTERRRMEEALRESERKYRELVQHANSIILRWTRDGRILFLNEFGQRFFGYTEAELCGRHVMGTLVPETESSGRSLLPLMDEICANPAAFEQVINENIRRNGERVWIAWTNKVVPDEQGQAYEVLSIGTDITARKQAEEALRARETQLSLIHDNSYEIMFALSVEPHDQFRFISVNHKFTEVTGLHEDQVVGKLVQEIIPEPACALVVGKYKDAIQNRQPVHWEEVCNYPTGRKTGEVAIAPVFDAGGKCTQLIGTVHDITERKRVEEELRRSESKYRTLVETSQDVIWSVDKECRITFISPAAQGVYGYEPEELLGRHLLELVPPEWLERELQEIKKVMVKGSSKGYEHIFLRKDRTPVYLSCNSVALCDDHGQVIGAMGVSTDITERKRAEEELRAIQASLERRVIERTAELAVARDRAEMADRTKSAFLATMSHELRTPLNSIIGFTGLLLQGLAGPLNAEQAKQLGMVKESGQHLLALINDVLDISKIEAGQIEIANGPFDLPESIQKVVHTVKPLANKKQLPLIAQIAADVGQITSDRRRVEQILLNLLSNAIKFTDRGEVTVTTEVTPGSRHIPRPAVRISVADTGIGIRRENLDKLFQPFRQLDTGLTRQHEGTGLGLAICKRLVERLGGTITVESEWGKGSTFLCVLPIHPERKS